MYVNYGRVEDFQDLERVLKIDVSGKICIARYAKLYRGDKVRWILDYSCITVMCLLV